MTLLMSPNIVKLDLTLEEFKKRGYTDEQMKNQ